MPINKFDTTVLLVGSGAVDKSWVPVIRAFEASDGVFDPDTANCVFANVVYMMRFFYSSKSATDEEKEKNKIRYLQLKEAVCYQIGESIKRGELRSHDVFDEILGRYVMTDTSHFALISTNWDTTIEDKMNELQESKGKKRVLPLMAYHIHGIFNQPDSLYLPTETVREVYRDEEEETKLGMDHSGMIHLLQSADRIVLYGISLDPLDAELTQIISIGLSTETKELIIIDPNFEKVFKRINIHISSENEVEIFGVNPTMEVNVKNRITVAR